MRPESDQLWKRSFVQFVADHEHLPVADPVKKQDTYLFAQEEQLFIHVEGEGDYPIDVESAAKNYNDWVATHRPPRIPG